MTQILGLDPGKATGMALYNMDTLKVDWVHEAQRGITGFKPEFVMTVIADNPRYIACERFDLRSSNEFVADLSGVEIIGWMKGEGHWDARNPMPVQHMSLTKLRKNKDKYQDSKITHLMKEAGFLIGEGHTRMALSVAVWYAAKILKHEPTLKMLSGRA